MDGEQGKRPLFVTCFEPFGGRQSNTSMRVLGPWLKRAPTGISVRVLPVDFQALRRLVPHMLRDSAPTAWLMLGEYGRGGLLRCERVAVNRVDSPRPDNRGVVLRGSSAAHGGPDSYLSTLDPELMRVHFEARGLPAVVSENAGSFACNLALYLGLHHASLLGLPTQVGFVHIPRQHRRTGCTLRELRAGILEMAEGLASNSPHSRRAEEASSRPDFKEPLMPRTV